MTLDLSANATLAVHVLVAVVERFALSATASVALAVLHCPGLLRIFFWVFLVDHVLEHPSVRLAEAITS